MTTEDKLLAVRAAVKFKGFSLVFVTDKSRPRAVPIFPHPKSFSFHASSDWLVKTPYERILRQALEEMTWWDTV